MSSHIIVAEHHRAVLCDVCSEWYRAKTVGISVEHYESLSFQDDFNWLCKFPKKVW